MAFDMCFEGLLRALEQPFTHLQRLFNAVQRSFYKSFTFLLKAHKDFCKGLLRNHSEALESNSRLFKGLLEALQRPWHFVEARI